MKKKKTKDKRKIFKFERLIGFPFSAHNTLTQQLRSGSRSSSEYSHTSPKTKATCTHCHPLFQLDQYINCYSNLNSINKILLLCKKFTQFSHCVIGRSPTLLSKQPTENNRNPMETSNFPVVGCLYACGTRQILPPHLKFLLLAPKPQQESQSFGTSSPKLSDRGSESLVDMKLIPKDAQTTRGQPSAAYKNITLKTETFKPSPCFFPMIDKLTKSGTLRPMDTVDSESLSGLWEVVKMLPWMSGKKSIIHVEELGTCDVDHWISIPETGHLMAEVYNRPVFYYDKSWIQPFFPLTTLPNNNLPIFIGLTESQHFVVLKMKDDNLFPAAQLEHNWEKIAPPEAMHWKIGT
ncbi:hypothetical protein VP01_620g6 [Puccinia sorghi]|uniref:Uncharacterized protein n=1 Tax=Puccinia sorghi TaxID=27349 RepID=A0A0L6UGM8_9BASI|nr:hypothetical protein VP01_620g6 [Puccinia sorghi]